MGDGIGEGVGNGVGEGAGEGVGTVLHALAPDDTADTFPAGHERQLACAALGWYFPLGQPWQCVVPVALANVPSWQSRQNEPEKGFLRPVAQPMHLSSPQFAVSVHAVLPVDVPLGHPMHAWVAVSK